MSSREIIDNARILKRLENRMNKVFKDLDNIALKRLYLALLSINHEELIQEHKLKDLGIGFAKLETIVTEYSKSELIKP